MGKKKEGKTEAIDDVFGSFSIGSMDEASYQSYQGGV